MKNEAARTAKIEESVEAPELAGLVGAAPAASGVVCPSLCPACIPVKSVPVGTEPEEVAEEVPVVIIRSSSVLVEVSIVDGIGFSEGLSVLGVSVDSSEGALGDVSMEEKEEDGSATEVVLVSSIVVIRGVLLPSVVEYRDGIL